MKRKKFLAKRDISIEFFQLPQGNVFIEAKFLDSQHLLRLELEIAPMDKKIIKARAEMPNSPFRICPVAVKKAKNFKGLVIEKGVLRKVAETAGGSDGCIHLRELASEAINFAAGALIGYESGRGLLNPDFEKQPEDVRFEQTKHIMQNSCLAYKK